MKNTTLVCIAIGAFLLLAVLFCPFHVSSCYLNDEFIINENMTNFRRKLLFNNTLETCVASNCGQVVEHNWQGGVFELNKVWPKPDWKISGTGTFTVKTKDNDLGSQTLQFAQKVRVNKDDIFVKTELIDTNGSYLEGYVTELSISRSGDQTLIKQSLYIQVGRRLPKPMQRYMDERVRAKVEIGLSNQQSSLRSIALNQDIMKFNFRGN